jgi:DNA-binding transcriptional ArsR family regulator
MDADAQVAPVAALLADPTRSRVLWALSDGRALPACDLALEAGVNAPTISFHLGKLVDGGLVAGEKQGRHKYYRLANPAVVGLLEALATVAPPASARTFQEGQKAKALRFARTCYDHLAGRLGVALTEALLARHRLKPVGRSYELTRAGVRWLEDFGIDVAAVRSSRRVFARACLDWTERRHHLAGSLGSALLERLFELRWIERAATGRALRVSERGRRGLRAQIGVEL